MDTLWESFFNKGIEAGPGITRHYRESGKG